MSEQQTAGSEESDAIRDVLVEASRTQMAATSAAVTFWSAWAESSAAYAESVSEELSRMSEGGADSGEFITHMTDRSREYLRKLTELPELSARRFNEELEKIQATKPKGAAPRKRAARAKE
jgi:hypothetical protein